MPNTAANAGSKPIVLAYSGGLDTSFLVPWVAENHKRPIITVTVDTGGIDEATARMLAERAQALGAIGHHQIDARADYFEQVLRFLIMGNVRRGQLYPLCVGAERVMQAQTIARVARELRATVSLRSSRATRAMVCACMTRGRACLPARALSAGAADGREILGQPRSVGRHHRRPGDAHLRRQHPR